MKHADLLMIGQGEKKHYDLIKDFNTFMYDHILHRLRKIDIVCKYLEQDKYWNVILKMVLKLIVNKLLRYLRSGNILHSKILEDK